MKPGALAGRTWRDIAYGTIPADYWMTRVHWHVQQLLDLAREAKLKLNPDEAHHQAIELVRKENLQREADNFALAAA